MPEKRSILAFIGARAGSKGLPDKNILGFGGKPLIRWTIEAALQASGLGRVVVSTDSEKIADAARAAGADVPFLRPEELARDDVPVAAAVQHCVDWFRDMRGERFEYALCLQPTSPLRTAAHIDEALSLYFREPRGPETTLVSVVEAPRKSAWLLRPSEGGRIRFCFPQEPGKQVRQKNPVFYYPNGAIYLSPSPVIEKFGFYGPDTLCYPMPSSASFDIDSREDFLAAQAALRRD